MTDYNNYADELAGNLPEPNQLVMINRKCDRKNRFFNIADWSEEQIQEKINQYPRNMWMPLRRIKP